MPNLCTLRKTGKKIASDLFEMQLFYMLKKISDNNESRQMK